MADTMRHCKLPYRGKDNVWGLEWVFWRQEDATVVNTSFKIGAVRTADREVPLEHVILQRSSRVPRRRMLLQFADVREDAFYIGISSVHRNFLYLCHYICHLLPQVYNLSRNSFGVRNF